MARKLFLIGFLVMMKFKSTFSHHAYCPLTPQRILFPAFGGYSHLSEAAGSRTTSSSLAFYTKLMEQSHQPWHSVGANDGSKETFPWGRNGKPF